MSPNNPDDPEFIRRMRAAVVLRDAPTAWVRRATELWPEHGLGLAGVVRRVVAALRFDSAVGAPLLSDVRSGGGSARHLLFSAEGRDIDLRIAPAGDAWQLAGQILGPDEAGRVEVVGTSGDAERVAGAAELNALGEFRVEDLAAGRYRIVLSLGHDEIQLPEVDVGHASG